MCHYGCTRQFCHACKTASSSQRCRQLLTQLTNRVINAPSYQAMRITHVLFQSIYCHFVFSAIEELAASRFSLVITYWNKSIEPFKERISSCLYLVT